MRLIFESKIILFGLAIENPGYGYSRKQNYTIWFEKKNDSNQFCENIQKKRTSEKKTFEKWAIVGGFLWCMSVDNFNNIIKYKRIVCLVCAVLFVGIVLFYVVFIEIEIKKN